MIKPANALRCLAHFALLGAGDDALAVYDAIAAIAGVVCSCVPSDEQAVLHEMEISASQAARAMRAADDSQLEFRQLIDEAGKERADEEDRHNGEEGGGDGKDGGNGQ